MTGGTNDLHIVSKDSSAEQRRATEEQLRNLRWENRRLLRSLRLWQIATAAVVTIGIVTDVYIIGRVY